MKAFQDSRKNGWELSINVGAVGRVEDALGIDLPGLYGDGMKGLAEFVSKPRKIVQVLWVLVEPQAQAKGVTPEAFAEGFNGDVLEEATDALLDELALFFSAPKRKALTDMLTKLRETADLVQQQGAKRIAEIDPKTEAAKIIEILDATSKSSSTAAPGSLESTQPLSSSDA